MKAIIATRHAPGGEGFELRDLPVPQPQKGEVLVKVRCSAVQPADLLMLENRYLISAAPPFTPGLLGVGEAVADQAGFMGRFLKGKRIFFGANPSRAGAWGEYAIARAASCFPINKKLSHETASAIGNGMTAIGIVESARKEKAGAIVLNAAAGNLARLTARRAATYGLPVIRIVRRREAAEMLQKESGGDVLCEADKDYEKKLAAALKSSRPACFFDSVGGGEAVARVMRFLPQDSVYYALGSLVTDPLSFNGLKTLMIQGLVVKAFVIEKWLLGKSLPGRLRALGQAQKLMLAQQTQSGPGIKRKATLEEAVASFADATQNMSAGKMLIYPGGIE